jgi:hypothetical protein
MIIFRPWRRFRANQDEAVVHRFLEEAGQASVAAFKKGNRSAKSGQIYKRRRSAGYYRASSPGEYPAIDTGDLDASISYEVSGNRMDIGSNMFYSKFLREGTGKMARRKMSDDALQEGVKDARSFLKGWVEWKRL